MSLLSMCFIVDDYYNEELVIKTMVKKIMNYKNKLKTLQEITDEIYIKNMVKCIFNKIIHK